ncbi:MAG TPA: GTPase ObgE [Atribacteraceae bacterium]|nr:GTPase ObgE [Atribacteraceae bacterium]
MFIDRAQLFIESGKGGDGAVSFRREKYVPRGGPNGGRGGNGGNVILRASGRKNTLYDLTFQSRYQAQPGISGRGNNRSGANGQDCIIEVPIGTQIFDEASGQMLADLLQENDTVIVARGGRGGRGNATFRTSVNRAPRFAEKGEPGKGRLIRLDLKLIADVGIAGLPNAGKSTFLAAVTRAKPLIAEYPFSTLQPNLGMVERHGQRLMLVDIPGIIQGAHQGIGLGLQFLRHIERTRFLLFLIDVSPHANVSPREAYGVLKDECSRYSLTLAEKPYAVVGTKLDLAKDRRGLNELEQIALANQLPIFGISAPTGLGIAELLDFLVLKLSELPKGEAVSTVSHELVPQPMVLTEKEYRFQSPFLEGILRETEPLDKEGLTLLNRKLQETDFIRYLKPLRENSIVNVGSIRFVWDGRKLKLSESSSENVQ